MIEKILGFIHVHASPVNDPHGNNDVHASPVNDPHGNNDVHASPVNDPHGNNDWRNFDDLSNKEIDVHITVEVWRVERQAVIYHRVQCPAIVNAAYLVNSYSIVIGAPST